MVCVPEFAPCKYKIAYFRNEKQSKNTMSDAATPPKTQPRVPDSSEISKTKWKPSIINHSFAVNVFLDILNYSKLLKELALRSQWDVGYIYFPVEEWSNRPAEFRTIFKLERTLIPYLAIPGIRDLVGDFGVSEHFGHEVDGYLE
ncbi:hypothetical protein TWF694_008949 [Orbilia ellipsospora]|uniref:Uncharacterized protein n=1 Tax=Orbilia ellipsospora TaxID=2528407 RepID=A0AAV9XGR1_9PEZI